MLLVLRNHCNRERRKTYYIEGNPLQPNNRGKICARGNAGVELLYAKDRLKNPMIRVGERGSGQWREVGWEEALHCMDKLLAVTKKYGVEANALFHTGPPPISLISSMNFGEHRIEPHRHLHSAVVRVMSVMN